MKKRICYLLISIWFVTSSLFIAFFINGGKNPIDARGAIWAVCGVLCAGAGLLYAFKAYSKRD